jgi:protein-S-isoprenylcysteine O-methyltransferase Ste14
MNPRKINPPHYFGLALVLMLLADQFYSQGDLLPAHWNWIGLVPVLGGIMVASLAARQFNLAGTNIIPLTQSSALVTEGMFRYSRNPMYLSMTTTLFGVAIILNNLWLLVIVAVFVIIIRYRFIRYEELLMKETFGDEYLAYCEAVRRWL